MNQGPRALLFSHEIPTIFFSNKIPDIFDKTKKDVCLAIRKLIEEMQPELANKGYPEVKDEDIFNEMRLNDMSNHLKKKVKQKQQVLLRLVEINIQSCLRNTYSTCSSERGKGMFQRIKDKIYARIDQLKDTMFRQAGKEITDGLELLKVIPVKVLNFWTPKNLM